MAHTRAGGGGNLELGENPCVRASWATDTAAIVLFPLCASAECWVGLAQEARLDFFFQKKYFVVGRLVATETIELRGGWPAARGLPAAPTPENKPRIYIRMRKEGAQRLRTSLRGRASGQAGRLARSENTGYSAACEKGRPAGRVRIKRQRHMLRNRVTLAYSTQCPRPTCTRPDLRMYG